MGLFSVSKKCLAFLAFVGYGISIPLAVSGDLIEVLPFGAMPFLVDDPAFPSPFWGGTDTFVFIGYFHYALLNFDEISITGIWGNITVPNCASGRRASRILHLAGIMKNLYEKRYRLL